MNGAKPATQRRALVAIPSGDMVHAEHMMSTVALYTFSAQRGIVAGIANPRGSVISKNRYDAVMAAQYAKATHLFMIDSDIVLPPNALARLMDRIGQRDDMIVGGGYIMRAPPFEFTAQELMGNRVQLGVDDRAFREVGALPGGCMLVPLPVFARMAPPYFEFGYGENGHIGEDIMFCRAARATGVTVWLDEELSHEIAHVGTMRYYADDRAAQGSELSRQGPVDQPEEGRG